MTFEEFFRKKRIELVALQQGEPALFSEFKVHFEQMGEKSFDHTKKYWFNKLRRRFPIPQEEKQERVHIANPLAEQTITESLIEPGTPPKQGFVPRFKAGTAAKPALPAEEPKQDTVEPPKPASEAEAPKPAFKPRFNPAMVKPKPVENEALTEKTKEEPTEQITEADVPAPKPAFKPRFNAAMVKPKPVENEALTEKTREEPTEQITEADVPAPKPAFKPRFNAAMMKPKPAESETPAEEKKEEAAEEPKPALETPTPKPGFKPRFNAAMMKPKPAEAETPAEEPQQTPGVTQSAPEPEVKPAYKPRFNMKTLPKNPPEE